jgi:hypothetical protein
MNRPPFIPPQIARLMLLAAGIVAAYLVARYFLTPPSFGQYGWFRGEALAEIASREPLFAGRKACDECHSDETQKLAKFEHKTVSCESCHGTGKAHADNPDIGITKLTSATACAAMSRTPPALSGSSRLIPGTITQAGDAQSAISPINRTRFHE